MTTAIDVMKYIKIQINPWGETQLQKLVYYSQAWSLVWDGRPLFDEQIEAWKQGPILRSLRFSSGIPGDAKVLDEIQRATVDAVLRHYGHMNGSQLSVLTHTEAPWLDARGALPPSAQSTNEISRDSIRRFHTAQALQGVGPRKKPQSVEADDDAVAAVAAEGAERWKAALALLAQ
jgi:uncharacterized phage-associated protein